MSSSSDIELSVVMPCLNEADTLATCIRKARSTIEACGLAAEIIVADNGSTDDSAEIARELGARVVPVTTPGYGAALKGGIEASRGRFIIMGDADDSYDFTAIMLFVDELRAGADLVMGCRLPGGGGSVSPGAMPWSHRRIGNPAFTRLARKLFRMPTHDVYCGLRGFTRQLYDDLELRCLGMEFATEMIIKASLFRKRITEVPITLHRDGRKSHPPPLNTVSDGLRTLRFFLIYSPRWLFSFPGFVLLGLGLIGFVTILPGPLPLGLGAQLDVHSLLVVGIGAVVGFQLIVFGLFTRLYAMAEGLIPTAEQYFAFGRDVAPTIAFWGGLVSFLSGAVLLGVTTLRWFSAGFPDLDYAVTMRMVIPAVTLIAIGAQAVFAGLFLGLITLHRQSGKPESPDGVN
jgi:glycosyltransferase involved in cell wall biosynthesis